MALQLSDSWDPVSRMDEVFGLRGKLLVCLMSEVVIG